MDAVHIRIRAHGRIERDWRPTSLFHFAAPCHGGSCRKMPNELLENIFLLAQEAPLPPNHVAEALACHHTLYPWPRHRCAAVRSRISLVCRRWHDVLHESARAWRDVEVYPGITSARLTATLKRSGSVNLHVRCYFIGTSPPWVGHRPLTTGLSEQCDILRLALTDVAPHANRITSLQLFAHEPVVVDTLLDFLDQPDTRIAPQTITIAYSGTHLYPREHKRHQPFPPRAWLARHQVPDAGHLPRTLRHVALRGSRLNWKGFEGPFGAHLTELKLEYIYNRVDLPEFVRFLGTCARLERLRLAGSFIRIENGIESLDQPDLRVVMPSLVELCLSEIPPDALALLLQRVEVPNLRGLGCDFAYNPIPFGSPDFSHFHHLLSEGALLLQPSNIRTLSLHRYGIDIPPGPTLSHTNFYQPFIAVTDLMLDFRHLQDELWEWLLDSVAARVLPALKTLTISGLSVVSVQEYVYMRHDAGLPLINIVVVCDEERLSYADDYHHATSLVWLRRHTLSCEVVCVD